MITPEIDIYEYYKYGVLFYGYRNIYDENNDQYYYYSDTTGEKVYGGDYETWHFFLDKDDVHYVDLDYIYELFKSKSKIKFNVMFTADTDPSQKEYDLNWNYDPYNWYQDGDEYILYAEIESEINGSNGNWMFDYPKDWKIKSLYEFHTESDEGSGSGGSIEPNIVSVDFRRADDLSKVISTESMFSGCMLLSSVDFSNSTLNNLTTADYMFYDCCSITENSIVINNATTFGKLESAYNMLFCNGDYFYNDYDYHYYDYDYKTSYVNELFVTKILGILNNGTFNTSIEDVYLKFKKNNIKYKINENSTVYVHPNEYAYTGNLTIPTTVTESNTTFSVTGISHHAFAKCTGLVGVSFSNNTSITEIPGYAFFDCTNLISVTIPQNVTEIKYMAFALCGITSITIPNGVLSVEENAFSESDSINSVTTNSNANFSNSELVLKNNNVKYRVLTKSTASVYGDYYYHAEYSGTITVASSITKGNTFDVVSVDVYAFAYSYINSLTLPNGLTSIGNHAFYDCFVESLNMDVSYLDFNNLDKIGFTFGSGNFIYEIKSKTQLSLSHIIDKNNIVGTCVLPTTVSYKTNTFTNITIHCDFDNCNKLVLLNSNGLTYSSLSRSFEGCTMLENVVPVLTFNDDYIYAEQTFMNCRSISSIGDVCSTTFNKTRSMEQMFMGCTSLSSAIALRIYSENTWNESGSLVIRGYYSTDLVETFKNCTSITSATLYGTYLCTNSIYGIFEGCSRLETVNMCIFGEIKVVSGDFRSYGTSASKAFRGCTNLESVTIDVPTGTVSWDTRTLYYKATLDCNEMFYGCESLKNITLATGNNCVVLGNISFADSPLLTFNSMKNVCQCMGNGKSVTFNDALWSSLDSQQITTLSELAQNKGATITNLT